MAAQKFYVVWVGKQPGIYTTWSEAEQQVKGFPKAKFKSFASKPLAQEAYAQGITSSTSKRTTSKKLAKKTESSHVLTADVDIFCDGACDPNPGKAGTGIAIYKQQKVDQLWYGLYNPKGTNNTAELLGLYHSLMIAKDELKKDQSITIHCDSKYSIDCITKWAFGWKTKGWKKTGGEIKNLDIIKPAHELFLEIANKIQVVHVKGHAGVEGNELADRMSVVAIEQAEVDLCRYKNEKSIPELLALDRG
jgi:ribonuclease HI